MKELKRTQIVAGYFKCLEGRWEILILEASQCKLSIIFQDFLCIPPSIATLGPTTRIEADREHGVRGDRGGLD